MMLTTAGGRRAFRRTAAILTLTALFAAWLVIAAPPASAALSGPAYPPPLGVTLGTSPATEAAAGKAGGLNWTYTGLNAGSYSHLYWGEWGPNPLSGVSTPTPRLAFDGAANSAGETLAYNAGLSNLAGGVAVWTGSAPCKVIVGGSFVTETWATRFTLTVTTTGGSPLALIASPAGVNNGSVVLPVTGDYKANLLFTASRNGGAFTPAIDLYNSLNTDPATQTIMSFAGGFWWNRTPAANGQSVSTNEDTPKAITLAGTDPDGNALTYTVVSGPSNGSISGGTGASRTYTPNTNFNGTDSFTFKVNDGLVDSATATVSITVTAVNDPPVANNQSVSTFEEVPLNIMLTGSDVEGSPLTFTVQTQPSNGTLTGTEPDLVYTPDTDFNGTDSFTFVANDGAINGAPGTITITVDPVNDIPVADDQTISTDEDTAIDVTLTATDVDGDPLTYAVVTGPMFGSLSGSAPNLTYTPDANFNGTDTLTFVANDGALDSLPATITLLVAAINDPPTADDQSVSTPEDTAVDVTLTGADVEGSPLSFTVVDQPANGTLSGTAPNLTYTPNENFNGPDSFTFRTNDGDLDSNLGTISINVQAVNDAPVADDQSVTLTEDTSASITLTGSDVDGDAITFTIVDQPSHGSLSVSGPDVIYTPDADYNGPDSFTFKVNDGAVDSGLATVSITVEPTNDAPVAIDQSLSTDEDTALGITLAATDTENGPLTYTVVSEPSHGELSGTAPALVYTPDANYHGPDSFTFQANDGSLDSNVATVTIDVISVNDAPTAVDDTASTPQYTPVTVEVLPNDFDVDGDMVTLTAVGTPAKGSAVMNGDGTITYTPNATFKGSDEFSYTISDPQGATGTGKVTILEEGCNEDGLEHLKGTPLEGVGSGVIDKVAEPAVGGVDEGLAATIHDFNCATVVPLEDSIDEGLPMANGSVRTPAAPAAPAAPASPSAAAPAVQDPPAVAAPRVPEVGD